MRLPEKDIQLFFKLYLKLLHYTNQKLKVFKGATTPSKMNGLILEKQLDIRDALFNNPSLIDSFTAENPTKLTRKELKIVTGWRHHVKGTFYLVRYLKRYAVFLDETATRAYGALALNDSLEEILGPELPVRLEAMLLPFKGRIVYDGLIRYNNIIFGRGFQKSLNEDYQMARDRHGKTTAFIFDVFLSGFPKNSLLIFLVTIIYVKVRIVT